MTVLPSEISRQLDLAPPRVRRLIERLCESSAARRLGALEALTLHEGDEPHEDLETLVDPILALATRRGYPDAAALLSRVADLLARFDDPPRSLSAGGGTEGQRRAFDRVMAHRRALFQVVRTGADPRSARLAATVLARDPANDVEIEPLLVALLSGAAKDEDEAAPLLYALARAQASRGVALHRRVAEALAGAGALARAACLALSEHAAPEPLASQIAATLSEACEAAKAGPLADPRAYGRLLEVATLERAIARCLSD